MFDQYGTDNILGITVGNEYLLQDLFPILNESKCRFTMRELAYDFFIVLCIRACILWKIIVAFVAQRLPVAWYWLRSG